MIKYFKNDSISTFFLRPMSFNLLEPVDPAEHSLLMRYCDSILDRGLNKQLIFITKNVNLHQQVTLSNNLTYQSMKVSYLT